MKDFIEKFKKGFGVKQFKKISKISITMYCLSVVLAIYGIYVFINYIYTMLSTKQLTVTGNEYTIINYYLSNFSQYIIFAILLASMGFVIQKIVHMHFSEIELSGNYSTTVRNISDISLDNDNEMFNRGNIENSILKK
ncbi:hypothetical protein OCS97_012255 [Clostridioides difficile]|nr:hypothetical protein [Clostridioides difficile]MDV9708769.1 hypothetical protein [Clostridioides difficile]